MEVELPTLAWTDLAFETDEPTTRGRKRDALNIDHMISIGGPETVRLGLDDIAIDDEIRPFVAARAAEAAFHLLVIACTVVPEENLALTEVSLDFGLTCADPAAPAPIALSMLPEQLEEPTQISRTVTLAAPLKLVDASVARSKATTTHHVYLQALNLQRPDPKWQLYATETHRIKGMHRLAMIIQAPHGESPGTLTTRATVQRKILGVFHTSGTYETKAPVTFTLEG